jgi:D-hydroxyproline dehydrogenase subunit alpha
MNERFDVVVVGGGPGGMTAAAIAAEGGRKVCLLDDNPAPGGQIWRGYDARNAAYSPHGYMFLRWSQRLARSGCSIWPGATVISSPQRNVLRVERQNGCMDIGYERLILATGARERFLPFPGWTLPGVMGVGGAQAFVKAGLDARGKRVVVAGSGPLLLAVAAGLTRAGAQVVMIAEQTSRESLIRIGMHIVGRHPGKIIEGAGYRWRTRKTPYRHDAWVVRAEGREWVESVTLCVGGREQTIACEWLACGYHLVPNLELPQLLSCKIDGGYTIVDEMQRSSVEGVACIGELTGIGGLGKAIVEGQIAGFDALGRTTEAYELAPELGKMRKFAHKLDEAFAPREELRALAEPTTIVCRCEDVTRGELDRCDSWRAAKLHTRCGMGACQGRVCGAAAEFLYGWQMISVRPPIYPSNTGSLSEPVTQAAEL